MEHIAHFLGSCIALFAVCMVGAVAVCAFRRCVAVFCVMVVVTDAARSAGLFRRASHWSVEEPAILALGQPFWLREAERVCSEAKKSKISMNWLVKGNDQGRLGWVMAGSTGAAPQDRLLTCLGDDFFAYYLFKV